MDTTVSTMDGYITIREAADIAGVTARRIHQMISRGQIRDAQRMGGYIWVVPEAEARRIAREDNDGKRGRPRGSGKS